MSNTTRVRARPNHRIQLKDQQSVCLGVLFGGAKGCGILEKAINNLPSGVKQPGFEAAAPWLAWQERNKAAGERHYQLTLQGAQLHPELRKAGCNQVELELQIKNNKALIAQRANWSSGQKPELEVVSSALQRTCNRAINTLAAFAFSTALTQAQIAQKIQQRLAPAKVKQHATHQEIRATAGRQLAFQTRAIAPNRGR